jgi:cytosine/adenosine deaminase-related metal-dependent hydrolase
VALCAERGSTDTPLLPLNGSAWPPAIAAFTIGSAYVNHGGHEAGSIEPGKRADLVLLDRALFALPAGRSPRPKWA